MWRLKILPTKTLTSMEHRVKNMKMLTTSVDAQRSSMTSCIWAVTLLQKIAIFLKEWVSLTLSTVSLITVTTTSKPWVSSIRVTILKTTIVKLLNAYSMMLLTSCKRLEIKVAAFSSIAFKVYLVVQQCVLPIKCLQKISHTRIRSCKFNQEERAWIQTWTLWHS